MLQASKKAARAKAGRKPSVLVLAPTRELAKQIATDFKAIITSQLVVLPVYGGVGYEKHTVPLSKGVDIIVGAPGRVKDLIERGDLSLKRVRFVVLDEVDRMLDMGFRDDVDLILKEIYPENATCPPLPKKSKAPQTMLFSATLPDWVNDISRRYLCPDGVASRKIHSVCLTGDTNNPLGNTENRTSSTVEHLALQCPWQERPTAIADVIRCYCAGPDSRCIVFCSGKKMQMNWLPTRL
jgi:ATP-dependent RNA helicase DDX21